MNERTRNEIIFQFHLGRSQRQIARQLHVSRNTVSAILREYEMARERGAVAPERSRKPRKSALDPYLDDIQRMLQRRPDARVTDLLRDLRQQGYRGSYTILREHVKKLRADSPHTHPDRNAPAIVGQFETAPVPLLVRGRRSTTTHLIQMTLPYSGQTYWHLAATADFATIAHEHVLALEWFGGAPVIIDYRNVDCIRANVKSATFRSTFMRLASHYGFRPQLATQPPLDTQDVAQRFIREVGDREAFTSIDAANVRLADWLKHARIRDFDEARWSEEREQLIRFPSHGWAG